MASRSPRGQWVKDSYTQYLITAYFLYALPHHKVKVYSTHLQISQSLKATRFVFQISHRSEILDTTAEVHVNLMQ